MRNAENSLLKIILSLVVVLITCGEVSAKDGLFSHLKHTKQKHVKKKSVPKPDFGSVIVRPWPIMNNLRVPLSSSSETLASVSGEYDLLGTAISLKQNVNQSDKAAFLIRSGTPTAITIIRKNRVLVFPRVMLLHPAIKNIRIRNGDIIASINTNSENKKRKDIYEQIIPPTIASGAKKEEVAVTFSGHLLPSKEENSQVMGDEFAIKFIGIELGQNSSVIDHLTNRTPIFVVRRIHQGTEYLYVEPFSNSGVFAENNELMRTLSAGNRVNSGDNVVTTDEASRLLWEKTIPHVMRNAIPKAGDEIEVTELEVFLLTNGYAF
ncbi:hypothetical protein V6x_52470 [Gimesia chilikensis]|uniref:Uncharacterized protein n=1 Tax=Gimesia chilikensis TaxID=2605989 RepID=A0A517WJT5_9PLAN|nr:hypothetical protein [Gimesia chilikensis]QDU05510.1 hypothetical protein V6x_52470 [Gimesia chilikensis]